MMIKKIILILILNLISNFSFANENNPNITIDNKNIVFLTSKIAHNKVLIESIHSFDEKWASQISTFFQTIYLDQSFLELNEKYDQCVLNNINVSDINSTLKEMEKNCDLYILKIKERINNISKGLK